MGLTYGSSVVNCFYLNTKRPFRLIPGGLFAKTVG
jgi:hypothetical protein